MGSIAVFRQAVIPGTALGAEIFTAPIDATIHGVRYGRVHCVVEAAGLTGGNGSSNVVASILTIPNLEVDHTDNAFYKVMRLVPPGANANGATTQTVITGTGSAVQQYLVNVTSSTVAPLLSGIRFFYFSFTNAGTNYSGGELTVSYTFSTPG